MSVARPSFHLTFVGQNSSEADLAIILYNNVGQLLQVCAGKNSCPAVITTGDVTAPAGTESVIVDFDKMQANVAFIIVAVALNGNSFSRLDLFSPELQYQQNLLALPSPTPVHNFAPILLKRFPGTVGFQGLPINAMDNVKGNKGGLEHIWRLADFVLQSHIPAQIWAQYPHSNMQMFALKKQQKFTLPKAILGKTHDNTLSFFGLGWSPSEDSKKKIDLDAHAYLIDVDTQTVEHIFFNNKISKDRSVSYGGDDRTGDGEEGDDDERIMTSLDQVARKIDVIFIVIRIYDYHDGQCPTFAQVSNEFCRAANKNGETIVRFALDGETKFADTRNVVMCAVCRDGNDKSSWTVRAIGESLKESVFDTDDSVFHALIALLK